MVRLMLETPVVARGGDRFVLRSFSPVTTIGGGVVLDPFSPPHTRLRRRRLSLEQVPAARLEVLAVEAGLVGLATDSLAVRLGVSPGGVTAVIAEAGDAVLLSAEIVVDRQAVVAEASRLAEVVRRYHEEHPLDPGMSLQALRAAVGTPAPPSAVTDAVLAFGVKSGKLEVAGSLARRPGRRPALVELGPATPAVLRDRLGLTRKYLIPLLEWADRRGVTRRAGDARVLARLTAGKGGS